MDVIFDNYKIWAERSGILNHATHQKLGQIITRLFDRPELCQFSVDGALRYHYKNLRLITFDEREGMQSHIFTVPPNFVQGEDGDQYIVNIPTMLICDCKDFGVVFRLNMESGWLQLLIGDKQIEPLDDYGIHTTDHKDRAHMNG